MASQLMKAIVYQNPLELEVTSVPVPEISETGLLIRVQACGICRTDLEIFQGHFISSFPLIPGHEFSGIVERVGARVRYHEPGDRITVDNAIYCGSCSSCQSTRNNFCRNFRSLGTTDNGGFAEYVALDESQAHPIGELPFEVAAFSEPLACAIHGLDQVKSPLGEEVAIFGMGPAGLTLVQLFAQRGAAKICASDPNDFKLELAHRLGATHTYRVDRENPEKHEAQIREEFPDGFQIVVEATGNAQVAERALYLVRPTGDLLLFGVCPEGSQVTWDPYHIFRNEIRVCGSFAQNKDFTRAVALLRSGVIQVEDIISHRLPLDRFPEGLELVKASHEKLKVMVFPSQV